MTKPHLFVGVPCYSGRIGEHTFWSLLGLAQACGDANIDLSISTLSGQSHVDRARNNLVGQFMRSGATSLLFLDDDIGVRPDHIIAMVRLDLDVVGAICPHRQIEWDRVAMLARAGVPASELASASTTLVVANGKRPEILPNGTAEVEGIGTGCLLVQRSVFERLEKAHADQAYHCPFTKQDLFCHFDGGVIDGEWRSEDYAFAHRVRSLGIRIFAYLPASDEMTHMGNHIFTCGVHKVLARSRMTEATP